VETGPQLLKLAPPIPRRPTRNQIRHTAFERGIRDQAGLSQQPHVFDELGVSQPFGGIMAAYRTGWQVNVEPRWGTTPIGSIRHSDVSGWVADLASRRGAQTVRTAVGVLRGILADAVADRMLAVNPAAGVKLPQRPPARHVYLTADQLARLADESGQYGSLVLLLGAVGPRFGEAAALRVADIDWLHRRVTLTRNAVTVNGRVVVGTLKGNKNRAVPLPGFVLDVLAETARGKGRDDLLWASSGGGYLMPPHGRMWLASAVARCQAGDPTFPRVTAHDLRHTAASLAIHAGAHPKVVQRMLGHTSAAMTLDVYADLFDSDLDAVAESVARMWSRQVNSH
jgi:integrase